MLGDEAEEDGEGERWLPGPLGAFQSLVAQGTASLSSYRPWPHSGRRVAPLVPAPDLGYGVGPLGGHL